MKIDEQRRQDKRERRRRRTTGKPTRKGNATMERNVTVQQCVELITSQAAAGARFAKAATTIKVAQIMQAARPVHDSYETERKALLAQYGTMDPETGALASNPDGSIKFKKPAQRGEFEQKHAELLRAQTTVTVPKLGSGDLEADGVTPAAIFPLLPFVDAEDE